MESEGAMLEESARSEKLLEGAEHGGAGVRPWHAEVTLCFLPQGRATESPAPLQTSPHPRWSQDAGVRAHDPVPGVVGGGQALRPPAPQRQHDHGERQDQHHGTPPRPAPEHLRRLEAGSHPKASPALMMSIRTAASVPLTPRGGPLLTATWARAVGSPALPEVQPSVTWRCSFLTRDC